MARRAVLSTLALLTLAQAAISSAQPVVVMSGLDNPRGLAFGPEGALYVAEAGRGGVDDGDTPCGFNAPGELRCYGPTGAITRLWRGEQKRIVTGLPSHGAKNPATGAWGWSANGPNDISFQGRGGAYVTIGLGDDLGLRSELGQRGRYSAR